MNYTIFFANKYKTTLVREIHMGSFNKFLGLISKTSENNDLYTIKSDILNQITIINDIDDDRVLDSTTGARIIFLVNKSNIVYGFMAYGTTGYAQIPYDIVSSCISTLCYHTLNTIRVFTNDEVDEKVDKKLALFAVILPKLKHSSGSDVSKILLKSMLTSMLDIQNQYEKYLRIYIKFD
jgi:uncharacterized protein YsxB (DUF464 family)